MCQKVKGTVETIGLTRTTTKNERKMCVEQKLKFQSQMKEKTHHSRQSLQANEIKYEMTTSL